MLQTVVSHNKNTASNTSPNMARWPSTLEHVDDFTEPIRKGEVVVITKMEMHHADFLVDAEHGVICSVFKRT